MDLRDAHDGAFERVHIAARNRLQASHDLRGSDNRIDREMRHRRMSAAASDGNFENIEGGHHGPGSDRELSGGELRPIMHPIDRFHGIFLQHSLLDHQPRTAFILLGRLKNEIDGSRKIPCFGKVLRGAQQHCRVAVVAAGMHAARLT
jgi:hypothetical protein